MAKYESRDHRIFSSFSCISSMPQGLRSTTVHNRALTLCVLDKMRVRSLRTTPTLRQPPRIMSVDKVPGVKMAVTGDPVREKISQQAEAGASKLAAAVARQRAERAAEREDAIRLAAQRAKAAANSNSIRQVRSQIVQALDAKIDGQALGKDVVSRALRRRSMQLDDGDRPLRLLFAGPSGVGKTAMATALCEALLGSCVTDRNFKRFVRPHTSNPLPRPVGCLYPLLHLVGCLPGPTAAARRRRQYVYRCDARS